MDKTLQSALQLLRSVTVDPIQRGVQGFRNPQQPSGDTLQRALDQVPGVKNVRGFNEGVFGRQAVNDPQLAWQLDTGMPVGMQPRMNLNTQDPAFWKQNIGALQESHQGGALAALDQASHTNNTQGMVTAAKAILANPSLSAYHSTVQKMLQRYSPQTADPVSTAQQALQQLQQQGGNFGL